MKGSGLKDNSGPFKQESANLFHSNESEILSYSEKVNSVPNDKILDWSKLKAFADDKIKVLKMMIFVFDRIENDVGKGEIAGYQHFLLFAQCFYRAFYPWSLSRDCVVKS